MTHSSSRERLPTSLPQRLTVSTGIPVEAIVWEDAYANLGDEADLEDPTNFGKTVICMDVGFVIRETKRYVVLGIGVCHDDNTVRHSNTIPKSMIISRLPMGVAAWSPAISTRPKTSRTPKKTPSLPGSSNMSTASMPSTGQSSTTTAQTPPSP